MSKNKKETSDNGGEYSEAVVRESHADGAALLKTLFTNFSKESTREQAFVSTSFAGKDRHEPHSPMLHKTASAEPEHKSLSSRVKKVSGRR